MIPRIKSVSAVAHILASAAPADQDEAERVLDLPSPRGRHCWRLCGLGAGRPEGGPLLLCRGVRQRARAALGWAARVLPPHPLAGGRRRGLVHAGAVRSPPEARAVAAPEPGRRPV